MNEADSNTEVLLDEVMDAIGEYLLNGKPVNYSHFMSEVMTRMRLQAIDYYDENLNQAAKILNIRRTTLIEYLRLKGWKRSKPARNRS
jgi:DNA-binding protein Fis